MTEPQSAKHVLNEIPRHAVKSFFHVEFADNTLAVVSKNAIHDLIGHKNSIRDLPHVDKGLLIFPNDNIEDFR